MRLLDLLKAAPELFEANGETRQRKLSLPTDAAIDEFIDGEVSAEKDIIKEAAELLQSPQEFDHAVSEILKTLRREGGRLPLTALVVDCNLPYSVVRSAVNILQRRGQVAYESQSMGKNAFGVASIVG